MHWDVGYRGFEYLWAHRQGAGLKIFEVCGSGMGALDLGGDGI